MQCPNCSRNIDETHFPASLAFCPYCGQDLSPVSQETERLAFCPYCGRELPDQTSFCPHCGKPLEVGEKRISGQKVGKAFLERVERVAQPIVKRVVQPIVRAVRNAFSSEKKTRKLFQQWSEYSELSPDEIPSIEALREMPEIGRARRSPRWYLAVGIAALIVIALVILLVNQC